MVTQLAPLFEAGAGDVAVGLDLLLGMIGANWC